MFRRLTTSSQQPPPPNSGVSRSSTTPSRRSGANNPFNDQLANLSLDDPSAPPPPDYQTALRHSVGAYPASQGSSQAPTRQGSYAPPPGPPPPARQQTRPLSTPQPQQQYQQPTGPPPSTTQHQWQAPTPIPAPAPVPSQPPGRQASVSGGGLARRSSVEDPLASLGKYDLAVVVDDSPSMTELWDETRSALIGLVQQSIKYDKDGIDLYWLNDTNHLTNVTDASTIREAFETVVPTGSTPTGYILDEVLRPYVEKVEDAKATRERIKPLIVLVITDGRADDSDQVKDCIIEMAQRLDDIRSPPYQLGIQFIQVGDDPDATAFLMELDDDLKSESGVRDIVDTTPYAGQHISSDFILKALLGSVVKRLDGQKLEEGVATGSLI